MRTIREHILVQLRDMILKGEFAPGEHLAEIPLAKRLNASRTPVRAALSALEKEGLAEVSPSGGYMMRQFSQGEVDDAIAVRGHLEGMAARLIAEQGVSRQLSKEFELCLRDGDAAIAGPTLEVGDFAAYTRMNDRFHALLWEGCGNLALQRCLHQLSNLPFAAPSALVPGPVDLKRGKEWLMFAHYQHRTIVQAMEAGEGTRAQAMAEEHVNISRQNLQYVSETRPVFTAAKPVANGRSDRAGHPPHRGLRLGEASGRSSAGFD